MSVLKLDAFVLAAIPAFAAASTRRLRWLAPLCILFFVPVLRQTGVSEAGLANAVRFASPLFLPLLVVAGVGIAESAGRRSRLRLAAVAFLGGTVALAAAAHAERNRRKAAVALGLEARDSYLESRINSYWAIRRAERELPGDRKILLVEQRSYYCRVPFVQASDRQREVTFEGLEAGRDLRALLDRLSVGMIVYSHSPVAQTRGFAGMLARLPSILADAGVEPLETRNECTLYRVR